MERRDIRVFVDSDVIVSALISQKGAAHLLLSQKTRSHFCISNLSVIELERVVKNLRLSLIELHKIIKTFKVLNLIENFETKYKQFATDPGDIHIITGADQSKSKFLITYNTKHYRSVVIRNELGIIVLTPGQFLQYLRSIGEF